MNQNIETAPLPADVTPVMPANLSKRLMVVFLVAFSVCAVAGGVYLGRGGFPGIWGDKSLEELLLDCQSTDNETRVAALITLGRHPEYLPQSCEAILPNLLNPDELVRIAAETAVRALREPLTPALKPFMMESDKRHVFYSACSAIRAIGPRAKEYLPILIDRLDSDDFNTRMSCLFALEAFGAEAAPALDKLIKLIETELPPHEFNLHLRAISILKNFGANAKAALPGLMHLAKEGNVSTRSMAYLAMGAIGNSDSYNVVEFLTTKLDAFYVQERERALLGLSFMGKSAAPALDKVKGLMVNPDKSVQPLAAFAYWKITDDVDTTLKVMSAALQSYDFRGQAIDRLAEMGEVAKPLVKEMAELLNDEEESVRESVIRAFENLGPVARDAIPHLKRVLTDNDLLLREAAREALLAIESPSKS